MNSFVLKGVGRVHHRIYNKYVSKEWGNRKIDLFLHLRFLLWIDSFTRKTMSMLFTVPSVRGLSILLIFHFRLDWTLPGFSISLYFIPPLMKKSRSQYDWQKMTVSESHAS
jgi:hypothetical protein